MKKNSLCCFSLTEFWSQLPQEGGAFYHPDTMDTARGHYKRCWPPILYALAIWLNEKGFAQLSGGGEETSPEGNKPALGSLTLQPANALANMKPEDVNKDRLHLILGEASLLVISGFLVLLCGWLMLSMWRH